MDCPNCKGEDTRVLETIRNPTDGTVRRRRLCFECKWRFSTLEAPLEQVRRRIPVTPSNLKKPASSSKRRPDVVGLPLVMVRPAPGPPVRVYSHRMGDFQVHFRDLSSAATLCGAPAYTQNIDESVKVQVTCEACKEQLRQRNE